MDEDIAHRVGRSIDCLLFVLRSQTMRKPKKFLERGCESCGCGSVKADNPLWVSDVRRISEEV